MLHTHLSGSEMSKHLQKLHPFLNGRNRSEPRVDNILDHDLQVLHAGFELVVVVMPGAGLHIQDVLLDGLQPRQVLLKGVLNLTQAPGQIGAAAAGERRDRVLFTLVTPRKVDLHRLYSVRILWIYRINLK